MKGISWPTFSSIVHQAKSVVKRFLHMVPNYPRDGIGGYLTLKRGSHDLVLANILIEYCLLEKGKKYYQLSLEKANRLFSHPHHLSSWQSRNEQEEKYGGAIKASDHDLIVSFSGLPELADEALCLMVATYCGWMKLEEAEEIANISNNEIYKKYKYF